MDQITFSDLEYQHKKRKTRRERFLERMDALIPWPQLEKKIRRHYPKAGRGRHPYPLTVMLRIHCVQLFYNLSDPAMEDMLYEIDSVRRFVGLKITGPIPDESTILKFRHLLETHNLGMKLFAGINQHLAEQGLMLKEGTIVDASIISAPSSTKNQSRERDPEMHQAKKGNEWHFGMKLHIGVDEELGLTHSLVTTAANVSDITRAADLLHGQEQRVRGDAGYQGIEKRPEHEDREVEWHIAMRPGKRAKLKPRSRAAREERNKASVRAKGEHPFRYVKRVFHYAKVRYRGLHKNTQRMALLLGFTNLLIGDTYEFA
ncbi:MAG: IS5 family transposase [Proteobacteria bacterium]|nr:IS5 family transposase [Pseudomonadota bacterium]